MGRSRERSMKKSISRKNPTPSIFWRFRFFLSRLALCYCQKKRKKRYSYRSGKYDRSRTTCWLEWETFFAVYDWFRSQILSLASFEYFATRSNHVWVAASTKIHYVAQNSLNLTDISLNSVPDARWYQWHKTTKNVSSHSAGSRSTYNLQLSWIRSKK